ncbi:50S ribosomal protein L13 [Candidatus Woesearchaeota archaeon]|nr:50S ribosomal protein L13 [Candidatus Woesearchaeota archaeon]
MIIDAKQTVLGRLAAVAAKQALLGNPVEIVNCEQAIISGRRENVFAKYKRKRKLGGPFQGPFIPRNPDMFVKRVIRGMLPYKQYKGRKAFERIRCYAGIPAKLQGQQAEQVADGMSLAMSRYVTVQEICRQLGSKR